MSIQSRWTAVSAALLCVFAGTIVCGSASAQSPALPPAPYHQCPAVGLDTSCRLLIVIGADGGQTLLTDANVSPTYDGADDTLIGVINLSPNPVSSIPLTSTTDIFGLDGDGVCSSSITPHPAGCPFGPTGYEGPGVSFASINATYTSGVVNFSPAIPANGGTAYFGLEEAIPTQCADADGDGLCDDWERNGLTVYVNGTAVFLDLPAMGADPNIPDIFVQADYMASASHSHQPTAPAMDLITKSFAAKGIMLHVDCGPMCVMNPKTGALWGALSQAHSLPHQDTLGTTTGTAPNLNYVWADYDTIKNANFSPAREQVFHYVVFAHNLGNLDGTSGISRDIPASNFIVSLGSWTGSVGTTWEQGGTFMHELGHNLSFKHGGIASEGNVNYKPNFLSVMNYLFQTRGVIQGGTDGHFDYSESALPSLNENSLNEPTGLGAASAGYGTRFYCAGVDPSTTADNRIPNANGPIDWNCNGASTDVGVSADINVDGAKSTLTGFADWPTIVYKGGAIGGLGLSLAPPATTLVQQELTPAMDAHITSPFKVAVTSAGSTQVSPGGSADLTFTITNTGTLSDTYTVTPSSSVAWANLTGVPASVSLSGGASAQITVTAQVPAGTAVGSSGTFSIAAASQSNPLAKDTGYARVSVAGGSPRLSGTVFSHATTGGTVAVNVLLNNVGPGPAVGVQVTSITARTLSGTGNVTLATPALPYSAGNVAAGGSAQLAVTLNVPATVTRFTLVESGTVQDAGGNKYSFSTSEVVQK